MAKHPWLRRTLGLGLLAGCAYALWRAIEASRADHETVWETQPFPFPPQPRPPASPSEQPRVTALAGSAPLERAHDAWVEPNGAACPASHPVKAKLSSRIFHVPGGRSYGRTVPDRCYVDEAAAEAEGFRAAKR